MGDERYKWLADIQASNLPNATKIVATAMFLRAGTEGTCFPSHRKIAQDCNINIRTAQRAIRNLIEKRLVKVVPPSQTLIDNARKRRLTTIPRVYKIIPFSQNREELRDITQQNRVGPQTDTTTPKPIAKGSVPRPILRPEGCRSIGPQTEGTIGLQTDLTVQLTEQGTEHSRGAPENESTAKLAEGQLREIFALDRDTETERTRIKRLLADFKAKGATTAKLKARIRRYRAQWPRAAITPEAILKHWANLNHQQQNATAHVPPKPGKYDHLT